MNVYELVWKSIPMGAISDFRDWYCPCLGSGVYMFVMSTTDRDNSYVGYYIGESDDIGVRWWGYLHKEGEWFCDPHEKFWIPVCSDDFLRDPVAVFNNGQLHQGLPDRNQTVARMLERTWFTFAEVKDLLPGHTQKQTRKAIEYVLQEALKKHEDILVDGEIGDNNRTKPTIELTINNHFGREFLKKTLPGRIHYNPDNIVLIE